MLILSCTRTKDESAEMAGNLLIPECRDFCTSSLATPRHKRKHPIIEPESRALYIVLDWNSLDQVLILPCTRTKDEAAEMAGNLLIPEYLDFCTSSLAAPQHKRKHSIKVHDSQGLYITLDWIIFRSGVDRALHANQGRISRNCRKYVDV